MGFGIDAAPLTTMGFQFGLGDSETIFKRKNRWLFRIKGVSAYDLDGVHSLPPSKAARPSISFKEIEAQHLTETVYFPGKPEWKPITLTLYEICTNTACQNGESRYFCQNNVVFDWLKKAYDVKQGKYNPSCDGFKTNATLSLYDGCGNSLEVWTFENCWPQNIEFGELDMQSSEVVTCDVTLRYDRAYIGGSTT